MESAGDLPDVFHRFPEAFLDTGQFAFQFLVATGSILTVDGGTALA